MGTCRGLAHVGAPQQAAPAQEGRQVHAVVAQQRPHPLSHFLVRQEGVCSMRGEQPRSSASLHGMRARPRRCRAVSLRYVILLWTLCSAVGLTQAA